MNIIINIGRVLFGLLGALQLFVGGMSMLRGLNILPGPTMGGPTASLIFGALAAAIGALLIFANWRNVRLALFVDGAVVILIGGVWLLQGLSLFPGRSFMNGDIKWAVIGGAAALLGAGLIFIGVRRQPTSAV
jgi:hypothetical protein